MQPLAIPLTIYYLAVIAVVCIYGVHRYWLVWTFFRNRKKDTCAEPGTRFESLPRVTVQLPMFNEKRVARRVIEAACAIDYPRELLEIQVLDDSTDESARIARECCRELAEHGHDIHYIHRTNREGFKAGALANGLQSANGDFIAIFDADFVPPANILKRTIHHFTNPDVGMVQTRWTHLNRNDSFLTQVQALYLDGHFVIEQAARASSGRWFNFNGTAGVWRRTTIENAGGWHTDTLTEDTDLSYRAQLKGWKFLYLPDVHCPAEVPPTVSASLTQQHRWNKGSVQTAIKLWPAIFKSNVPWRMKTEAWFHLTSPVVYVMILLLAFIAGPALFVAMPFHDLNPWIGFALGSVMLALGTLAACTFYVVSQWEQGVSVWRTLLRLPALMAVGVGISLVNSRAVVEAVFGKESPFIRTPKYNGDIDSETDPVALQSQPRIPKGLFETLFGVILAMSTIVAITQPHTLLGVPFLALFSIGFLLVGVPRIRDSWKRRVHESHQTVPAFSSA